MRKIVIIIQFFIVGTYTLLHNRYQNQFDLEIDRPQLNSVNKNETILEISISTNDFIGPVQQNNHGNKKNNNFLKENSVASDSNITKFTESKTSLKKVKGSNKNELKGNDKDIRKRRVGDNWRNKDATKKLIQIYEKKETSDEKYKNYAQKHMTEIDSSSEAFEDQLSRFLGFSRNEQKTNQEDVVDDDENRVKRESETDMHYIFNVRPVEEMNDEESTSTEIHNLTSINSNEMEEYIGGSETFPEKDTTSVNNSNNNTFENQTFTARLTSFFLSTYAELRKVVANVYAFFSRLFQKKNN